MQIKQTKALESVFRRGRHEAQSMGATQVSVDHLFLGILKEGNGHAYQALKKLLKDWELYQIRIRVERDLNRIASPQPSEDNAQNEDTVVNQLYIDIDNNPSTVLNTGHLLMSMLRDKRLLCSRILEQYNVTGHAVAELLRDLPPNEDYIEDIKMLEEMDERGEFEEGDGEESDYSALGTTPKTKPAPAREGKASQLEKFGVDLTRSAAEGKIDPVIGRNEEIDRVIQILGRRKKNNPVLIGEPGVGKSAIAEGLALRIVNKEVPHTLRDKKVFALDITSLVAGTKYRGQFEERIKELLTSIASDNNIILFIDEIHNIVGAGSSQGSLDTANILKPALARGELQCIGATTLKEYRENIETDGALEACVSLAERYVTDRFFPDKAIDVMDEAGSKAHVFNTKEPEFIGTLEEDIKTLTVRKKAAIEKQEFEKAAELRNEETALKNRIKNARKEWKKDIAANRISIDEQMIREVVAAMTGIPASRISQSEATRLKSMNEYLSGRVIGQADAVNKVTRAIHRSRAGLKDPNRPIGVFMFTGPTGVGKTHLAKELAKYLFDKEDALIRVDMSEYAEKHNVSRLIGSPPGYVGYGEGGQLTEKVRRHPYSVLLFDEIEKAHPDIFNVMLQIFDDGQLTDGLGRKVDFRNTIIIMTSNIGSREVSQYRNGLGYNTTQKQGSENVNREAIFRKSLEENFAPEFINRIDDIVTFGTLSEEDVRKIVELEFENLHKRVASLGYNIEISSEALTRLVGMGYEPRYGVRSLKRTLLDTVEEPLADMIVEGALEDGATVDVACKDREIELSVKTAS